MIKINTIIIANTNSSGGYLQIDFDNEDDYTIKLRVSSEVVDLWSEWIDLDFTIKEIIESTTSLSDTPIPSDSDEPGIYGFQLIYSLFALVAIPIIYRRIKK